MTITTSATVSINSNSTSETEALIAVVRSVSGVTWMEIGKVYLKLGQNRLDGLYHADGVGAGLPLNVDDDRRRLVHPRCLLVVLDAVHHLRNIAQHDGRAIAVGNHNLAIVVAGYQLIVGIDLVILMRPVEVALGGIDAGLASAVRKSSRLSP
jgi:hypothetical protein